VGIAPGPSGETGGDLSRKKSPPPPHGILATSIGSAASRQILRRAKITLRNGARIIDKPLD
jgi:hypothetical protein